MMTALKDGEVLINLFEILVLGACMKFSSIFISPYLSQNFNLSATSIGLFFSGSYLINSIAQTLIGRHMDRGVSIVPFFIILSLKAIQIFLTNFFSQFQFNLNLLAGLGLSLIISGLICFNPPSFLGFERYKFDNFT